MCGRELPGIAGEGANQEGALLGGLFVSREELICDVMIGGDLVHSDHKV